MKKAPLASNKRSLEFFLIGVLIVFCSAGTFCCAEESSKAQLRQNEQYLSIEDIISSTLSYHPLMNAAHQDRLAADGEFLSSEGAFDRVIRGDAVDYGAGGYSGTYYNFQAEQPLEAFGSKIVGGYRQGSGTFPVYDNYYETNSDGELRLGVDFSLLRDRDLDRRRVNLRRALLQQEISGLSVGQRKLELARAAAFAFLEWSAAHARSEVYSKLLRVAKERDKQFDERTKAGDLAEFDRVDNQRQVLQREAQLLAAERSLNRAHYELSYFWRDEKGSTRDTSNLKPKILSLIATEISVDEEAEAIAAAFSVRPDLERLDKLRSQQQLEEGLAENDLLPRLDMQSYLARDLGTGSQNRDETELRLGLRLEVPLQTRSQKGRKQQASAKAAEATFQAEALRDRIKVDVRDTSNAIALAKERLQLAKKEVALAGELEDGERTKFTHGDSTLIFVNLREQASADAAIREIDTHLELQKLLVSYDTILGRDVSLR